jgi:hypothetical protein
MDFTFAQVDRYLVNGSEAAKLFGDLVGAQK